MTVFGNAKRLAAWAGVCPGNHESAGKKKSTAARKGNIHLKTTLVQAAVCAARTKGSYYKDKYHRLKARRGSLRAAMAIAHKILVAVFHMLAKTIPFKELGEAFLDQQASQAHHDQPGPAPQQPRIRRPPPAKGRRMTPASIVPDPRPVNFRDSFYHGFAEPTAARLLSRHALL